MKELFVPIISSLLIVSWIHALYRHWSLVKELKANRLPASNLIGGLGVLRDVKEAYNAIKTMDACENRNKLASAAKWADISPLIMISVLVVPFIILLLISWLPG